MPDHNTPEVSKSDDSEPYFSRGPDTLKIPLVMHRDHRRRLAEAMLKDKLAPEGGTVYIPLLWEIVENQTPRCSSCF